MFRQTRPNAAVTLAASILSVMFLPVQAQSADQKAPMSRRALVRPFAGHAPRNVSMVQFNNDGTKIFWTNTSNTRTVYFMSHSEMDNQPNGCPVCATMQIELIVAGKPFKYQPTKSIDAGCSAKGDPAPSFDISSGFLPLAPNTYYAWQARIIANYLWLNYDNGNATCVNANTTFASGWQVGAGFMTPGYFSFKTP